MRSLFTKRPEGPRLPRIDGAIRYARAMHASGKQGLWSSLVEACRVPEEQLVRVLDEQHGITVLDESALPPPRVLQQVPSVGTLVEGPRGPLLVCDDPWSPLAVQKRKDFPLALARRRTPAPAAGPATVAATPVEGSRVVAFVDEAIATAYRDGASDVHFESDRTGLHVKYRLDGVMAPATRLEGAALAEEAISRIKVLAQLDITERRRPQDGRFRWQAGETGIDLRVSIMPSIHGEDAVLRLLDKAQLRGQDSGISLDKLGFDAPSTARIRALASRPHGMLLVTGPTGSGKTTTLYAALSEVNNGLEKVVTIEDPVEYELPGVLQIPVNEQKGLTFASGLRSILRHDPDKILVGEIRDSETAEIAVQSALTGHLVLTTVHANSFTDVIGRFQHFAIDPFALASALNGIVVQRLLRRLCPHCTQWHPLTAEESRMLSTFGTGGLTQAPRAEGCDHCRRTGYRGRFVVAEIHELSDAVRDLMLQKASMTELKVAIASRDSLGLTEIALEHVRAGSTSLEEIARVIGLR